MVLKGGNTNVKFKYFDIRKYYENVEISNYYYFNKYDL